MQTLLAQVSGIRHPKQPSHPRRIGTNGTPPSARRMWHDRAAHACDFAQRYAERAELKGMQSSIGSSRLGRLAPAFGWAAMALARTKVPAMPRAKARAARARMTSVARSSGLRQAVANEVMSVTVTGG